MKRFLILLTTLALLCGATACALTPLTQETVPQAAAGVIDLRQWDFTQNGIVNLNGEWKFYWGQLLTTADLSAATPPVLTGLIAVPSSWRGYQVNGQPLSGEGYATYRLTILLNPSARSGNFFSLKMPLLINTAHRIYVNGQLVGEAGRVGSTAEAVTPEYKSHTIIFAPTSDQVDILLQVSNFHHFQGGVTQPIVFGTQPQVQRFNDDQLVRDLFLIGASVVIGFYHLGLFFLHRQNASIFFFGVFCIFVSVSTLITRQPQIVLDYINQNWTTFIRVRFFIGFVSPITLTLFVQSLFPQKSHTLIRRIFLIGGLILAGLVLMISAQFTTALVAFFSVLALLLSLYNLGIIIFAVVNKISRAGVLVLAYIPFLFASVNDLLYFNGIVQTGQFIPAGVFILILAQACLLAIDYAESYNKIKALSADLQHNFNSLQDAQDKLRLSEIKYRSIFEDSKDLIFITTLDGQVEAINPACFEVLGYTHDEALNLNALNFYASPTERQRFQAAIAHTGVVKDFPVRLRHKTGDELECQLTATSRYNQTGQIIGYQGIVHDVTIYKQIEAQRQRVLALQDLNQSLEQRIESRTTALAETNTALQSAIEQRQIHQKEKDRLLALAQQQSEHLRTMSNWLREMQTDRHQNQAAIVDEGIRQKIIDLRQNLSALQGIDGVEQSPGLATYVSDTIRLLIEMEIYVEQVTTSLDELPPVEDPLASNALLQISSRERQVLKLMAEGKSNPEIADILTIRLNTVHTYLKRIRLKLDIQDTPGLINFARENGLLK